jgi:hypothetical protein
MPSIYFVHPYSNLRAEHYWTSSQTELGGTFWHMLWGGPLGGCKKTESCRTAGGRLDG